MNKKIAVKKSPPKKKAITKVKAETKPKVKAKTSPVKVAKDKKTKKATERKPYEYTPIADLLKNEARRINLYAVVLDCSAPYLMEAIGMYMCTLKLIDATANPRDTANVKQSFLSATIRASTKEQVPSISMAGSIIRIHRANVMEYKKGYQLTCDVGSVSAWVLFDSSESMTPISHSGQSYTLTDADKKRLKDMRKFSEKFFKEYDFTSTFVPFAPKGEVDRFALVLNRKNHDKTLDTINVFNGEKFFSLNVVKDNYACIVPEDIVRIRGVTTEKLELGVSDYSNVIRIGKNTKTAKELLQTIAEAKKDKRIKEKLLSFA